MNPWKDCLRSGFTTRCDVILRHYETCLSPVSLITITLLVWKLASDLLDKRSHMGRVAFSLSVILLACCSNPERRRDIYCIRPTGVQRRAVMSTETYWWMSGRQRSFAVVMGKKQHKGCPRRGQRADGNFLERTWKIHSPPTHMRTSPLPARNVAGGYGTCILLSVPD